MHETCGGLLQSGPAQADMHTDGATAGGHIVHVASTLGQLDGIPLEGVKAYISGAKSIQELMDMPYPADEVSKVPSVPLAPCAFTLIFDEGSQLCSGKADQAARG